MSDFSPVTETTEQEILSAIPDNVFGKDFGFVEIECEFAGKGSAVFKVSCERSRWSKGLLAYVSGTSNVVFFTEKDALGWLTFLGVTGSSAVTIEDVNLVTKWRFPTSKTLHKEPQQAELTNTYQTTLTWHKNPEIPPVESDPVTQYLAKYGSFYGVFFFVNNGKLNIFMSVEDGDFCLTSDAISEWTKLGEMR